MENVLHAGLVPETHRSARRIHQIGWAFFLVMTGSLWLIPDGWLPEGSWLAGTGLIMVAVHAARWHRHLRTDAFGIIISVTVLVAGVGQILDREISSLPVLVIVLGVAMVIQAVARRRVGAADPVR